MGTLLGELLVTVAHGACSRKSGSKRTFVSQFELQTRSVIDARYNFPSYCSPLMVNRRSTPEYGEWRSRLMSVTHRELCFSLGCIWCET